MENLEAVLARVRAVLGVKTDKQMCEILDISYDEDGITEIAKRSRGTPRIANRLLKRARDFALVEGSGVLEKESVDGILKLLGVDENGLDELDRNILLKS